MSGHINIIADYNLTVITFLNILVFIKRHQGIILPKSSKSVDKMSAEVGVDVLGGELGIPLSVDRPVGVVTNNFSVIYVFP